MPRIAKQKEKINRLTSILGYIPESPRHLSAYTVRGMPDCPAAGFTTEEIKMVAELMDENVIFSICIIVPEKKCHAKAKILISDRTPAQSTDDLVLAIIDAKKVALTLEPHLAPTRRRADGAGHLAILSWAAIRACEYLCHRFGLRGSEIIGEGIYYLSAEYAIGEYDALYKADGEKCKISEDFVKENPRLFSPRFARNYKKTRIL